MIVVNDIFSETITDNNGITVTDINKGLKDYYPKIFDTLIHNAEKTNLIIVDDTSVGQPDLIASKTYGTQDGWFFFLLSNFLKDPFNEVLLNYIYYIYKADLLDDIEANISTDTVINNRVGVEVTLN